MRASTRGPPLTTRTGSRRCIGRAGIANAYWTLSTQLQSTQARLYVRLAPARTLRPSPPPVPRLLPWKKMEENVNAKTAQKLRERILGANTRLARFVQLRAPPYKPTAAVHPSRAPRPKRACVVIWTI
eukprot:COSAG02_NODE_12738_length_1501_cov_1.722539_1_plen_128_part_00